MQRAVGGFDRRLGAGVDEVGDGFCLGKVDFAVLVGAAGVFARLGEAGTGVDDGGK